MKKFRFKQIYYYSIHRINIFNFLDIFSLTRTHARTYTVYERYVEVIFNFYPTLCDLFHGNSERWVIKGGCVYIRSGARAFSAYIDTLEGALRKLYYRKVRNFA